METKKIVHVLIAFIAVLVSSCIGDRDLSQVADRSNLKIALIDSLDVEYDDDDDERRLPESIRNLCAVLSSENKNCNRPYILDPVLLRLDQKKELSLKTTIEKGGSKDVSNPKVIGKLIQKNFDEIEVPKDFLANRSLELDINKIMSEFVSSKAPNDSIIVFIEEGPKEYALNDKIYKVYNSIDEVRTRITSILCENDRANFTLLFNPPIKEKQSPVEPIEQTNTASITKKTEVASTSKVVAVRRVGKRVLAGINGDLTIMKDTEGCDICTRYYTATDNLGRRHEVKEKNSTFCCPCDKTVQIRGRTYRMECDGNNNRLALVE